MTGHKEEIGNALRDARQKAGLTLKDIADAIRIRPIYLQAIEAGQFELLPALPQTVGFTRAYAKYLDVDVERPLSRLGEEVHETIERADYSEPEIPWTMISTRRLAWVGGGVLFGLLLEASFVIDFDPPREEIAVASVEAEKAAAIAARAASAPAVPAEVRSVAAVADRGNTILPAAPETQASGPVVADLVSRAPAREAPAMLQQASFTSGRDVRIRSRSRKRGENGNRSGRFILVRSIFRRAGSGLCRFDRSGRLGTCRAGLCLIRGARGRAGGQYFFLRSSAFRDRKRLCPVEARQFGQDRWRPQFMRGGCASRPGPDGILA